MSLLHVSFIHMDLVLMKLHDMQQQQLEKMIVTATMMLVQLLSTHIDIVIDTSIFTDYFMLFVAN